MYKWLALDKVILLSTRFTVSNRNSLVFSSENMLLLSAIPNDTQNDAVNCTTEGKHKLWTSNLSAYLLMLKIISCSTRLCAIIIMAKSFSFLLQGPVARVLLSKWWKLQNHAWCGTLSEIKCYCMSFSLEFHRILLPNCWLENLGVCFTKLSEMLIESSSMLKK